VKKSDNLAKDVEKALMSFSEVEVMPAKIVIYGDDKVAKYKEELTSYSWMSQLPFLHLPKIEDLDPGVVVQAVAYAGASEIDPDVHVSSQNLVEDVKSHGKVKHLSMDEEPHHKGKTAMDDKHGLDNVGFVTGDIADANKELLMEDEELGGGEDVDVYGRAVPMRRGGHVAQEHKASAPLISAIPKMGLPGGIMGLLGGSTKLLIIPLILLVLVGVYMYFLKAAN
jgi:hypothetical protein